MEESLFDWAEEHRRYDVVFSPYVPKDEREWRREHLKLSFAVMLWEMILKDDTRLNGIIEWNEGTKRAYVRPFPKNRLSSMDFERGEGKIYYPHFMFPSRRIENYRLTSFDAKTAASLYIREEICRKMECYPLALRVETDDMGKIREILEPTNLLSEMWYLFFLAFSGKVKLRRCSVCGKWENMEGHRKTWSKHPNCANYQRVKRARQKKRAEERP
ncbi:MAG: hypothetical protein LBS53_14465 [Synergistaceae bacterium]|jgi:hypothetical protein|nr:hypothetical protein [Synergistaceae bacterium]